MSRDRRRIRKNSKRLFVMDKILQRGRAEAWPKILLALYFLGQIGAAIAGFTEFGKSPTLEHLEALQIYGIFMSLFGLIGIISLIKAPRITAICLYVIGFFTFLQGLALIWMGGVSQTAVKVLIGPAVSIICGYLWARYNAVITAILGQPSASRKVGRHA